MVDRIHEPETGWVAVDDYVAEKLLGQDAVLEAALAANAAAGLPEIDVSPPQGKMLHLIARMANARRILEIGTLGGYSSIWLARALPENGKLVTLELEPDYAEIARCNLERAGMAGKVEIRVGPAVDSLKALIAEAPEPFDFVFIDADKANNSAYVRAAIALSRPGTTIVVDNVIREGGVLEPDSDDERIVGTRALFDLLAAEPRLSATAVQTVGAKKWDGFVLAVVG